MNPTIDTTHKMTVRGSGYLFSQDPFVIEYEDGPRASSRPAYRGRGHIFSPERVCVSGQWTERDFKVHQHTSNVLVGGEPYLTVRHGALGGCLAGNRTWRRVQAGSPEQPSVWVGEATT